MPSSQQDRPRKRRRLDSATSFSTPWQDREAREWERPPVAHIDAPGHVVPPTSTPQQARSHTARQYREARERPAAVNIDSPDHEVPATISPTQVTLGERIPLNNFVINDLLESSTDSDEPDHFYHDADFSQRPRPHRRSTADEPILISDDPDIDEPGGARIPRRTSTSQDAPVIIPDDDEDGMQKYDDSDIEELPGLPVREGEAKLANSQCAICMDDWKEVTVTKCGHVFCYECIMEAIRMARMGKPRCPFCRTTFTGPVTVVNPNSKRKPQIVPMMFKLKRR